MDTLNTMAFLSICWKIHLFYHDSNLLTVISIMVMISFLAVTDNVTTIIFSY